MENNLNEDYVENDIEKNVGKQAATYNKRKNGSKKRLILFSGIVLGIILCVLIAAILPDKSEKYSNEKNTESTLKQNGQVTNTLDEMLKEKGMEIKTPFVSLFYNEKWEKQIRVEQIESDGYTVKFFGTIKGKDEAHLFDIVFGKTEGTLLGTINEKEVYLIHIDISLDDNWNEENQNEIINMQEDVNYVIGMLQKEEGFVPAS